MRLGHFQTFDAAQYTDVYSGDTRIYCLGQLPKHVVKQANSITTGVRFVDHGEEYYLISWLSTAEPKFAEFHPFGLNFILAKTTWRDPYVVYRGIPTVIAYEL